MIEKTQGFSSKKNCLTKEVFLKVVGGKKGYDFEKSIELSTNFVLEEIKKNYNCFTEE